MPSSAKSTTATLSEVMLAEHSDFESKLARIARRRRWLESNQALLRTLLSFSVLHGSSGGGLISMRMELLLLLQELQQQSIPLPSAQQKLTTPLPLPTTLPLLSAAVAGSKTVVADPLQHLQCMTRDLLHTIIEFIKPPDVKTSPSKVNIPCFLCVIKSYIHCWR
jgi:DmX-like protein